MICLGIIILGIYFTWSSLSFLDMYIKIFHHKKTKIIFHHIKVVFAQYFFKYLFCLCFFSWIFHYVYVRMLVSVPRVSEALFFFNSFSFCSSNWVISWNISSLISVSSAWWTLFSSPTNKFSFFDCIFLQNYFYLVL